MGNCQPEPSNNGEADSKKKTVIVVYGGPSVEHEVSCRSASFILSNIDQTLYDIIAVGVGKDGSWWPQANLDLKNLPKQLDIITTTKRNRISLLPLFDGGTSLSPKHMLLHLCGLDVNLGADSIVLFPIIHGTHGEDGTLQGWCELAGIAYVGPDTVASALSMDKVQSKRVVESAKTFSSPSIQSVPFVTWTSSQWKQDKDQVMKETINRIGNKLFVKPVSLGSSVGVTKVTSSRQLKRVCELAFAYDDKIMIEKHIENIQEIECAVLGGSPIDMACATPGEVIVHNKDDFYSYDAKYIHNDSAEAKVPANLSDDQTKKIRQLSIEVANMLGLSGMARIDWFLEKDNGQLYFNECNTIPGFTAISLYPQMWEYEGVSGGELVQKLIKLGVERALEKKKLTRVYQGKTN